jgi:hypothetical protein
MHTVFWWENIIGQYTVQLETKKRLYHYPILKEIHFCLCELNFTVSQWYPEVFLFTNSVAPSCYSATQTLVTLTTSLNKRRFIRLIWNYDQILPSHSLLLNSISTVPKYDANTQTGPVSSYIRYFYFSPFITLASESKAQRSPSRVILRHAELFKRNPFTAHPHRNCC